MNVITLAGHKPKPPRPSAMTADELGLLRAIAPRGMKELRKHFPGRTPGSLRGHARRNGIFIAHQVRTNEWKRGNYSIPAKCHPLVRRLFGEINRQGVMLDEMAERTGVSKSSISKWRHCHNPNLTGLIAAFNVLGMELRVVRLREESEAA